MFMYAQCHVQALACTVVIPVLSPTFFGSPACAEELTFAKNKNKVKLLGLGLIRVRLRDSLH